MTQLSFLQFVVFTQLFGYSFTLQLVFDHQQSCGFAHDQLLVGVDDVRQRFQLVSEIAEELVVLVTGHHVEDFLCRDTEVFRGFFEVTEQATTCIPRFQHLHQLLLGLGTVEQLGWGAEQHHVGRGAATNFFMTVTVGGGLDQLGLYLALVVQLKEGGEHLGVAHQVGADLVDLQVDRASVGHQQLVTHLLHGRTGTRVKAEKQVAQTLELLGDPYQFFIWIAVLTHSTFMGDLGQVTFRHQRKGLLQESFTELVHHLVFDDRRGEALTCARRRQVDGVQVDWDVTPVWGGNDAAHLRSGHGPVVTHQYPEEQGFRVLRP